MKHVTEEQLAEQRKRVLARDDLAAHVGRGPVFFPTRNALEPDLAAQAVVPTRAEFDRRMAQIRARDDAQDVDAGCVHCPTCGNDVPVEEWQIATDDSFAYPKGSAGHGPSESFCVTVPYRGPWWLRALLAIKKWSEA